MPNPHPSFPFDLDKIAARNETARHIITGFATATPTLADIWQSLSAALADTVVLGAEVSRMSAEIAATRLDRANLIAAIRATLAANADGEPDPLSYVRDEMNAHLMPYRDRGRAS